MAAELAAILEVIVENARVEESLGSQGGVPAGGGVALGEDEAVPVGVLREAMFIIRK
jgi:hypothetical protein